MKPLIVGLMGKKRAGKDTVAQALVEHRDFVRVAFADPLKDMMLTLDPYVGQRAYGGLPLRLSEAVSTYGWDIAKEGPEVRRLLQVFGAEVVRDQIGEDVWIRLAEKRVRALLDEGRSVVISDVRFLNEADFVRSLGGKLWLVERPGHLTNDVHVSENVWQAIEPDITINNDETVDWLIAKACSAHFLQRDGWI